MLSYEEALARILATAPGPLPAEIVPVDRAAGRVLAHDIVADTDIPAFANSAVDGFAVRRRDTADARSDTPVRLRIVETIPAGRFPVHPVRSGEAARIFTGAPMPEGADGLVMVEDTDHASADTWVEIYAAGSEDLVRASGSDIRRGERVLPAGSALGAGAIGLLSALNHAVVACVRQPRVALLTTGDEIIPPGPIPLAPGQIRDANGPALAAAVQDAGAVAARRLHARDDRGAVRDALAACKDCDVIVVSGGVSVGDYDYVKEVVELEGKLDFWRVAVKPGKPLAFGQVRDLPFFGLPGNPVSSLVTFELFVRPFLRRLAGHTDPLRTQVLAKLVSALPHAPGRREFVRATISWKEEGYEARETGAQGSHRLGSLVGANALLVLQEERGDYRAGERVPALLLT